MRVTNVKNGTTSIRETHTRLLHNAAVAPKRQPTPELFNQVVARRMHELGLNQEEAAKRFGVSQPQLSKWLSGTEVPRDQRAGQIAEVLGLDLGDVLILLFYGRRHRDLMAGKAVETNRVPIVLTPLEWGRVEEALQMQIDDPQVDEQERAESKRLLRELRARRRAQARRRTS